MSRISDIMTKDVQCVAPDDSLQRAARIMSDLNVGVLPVSEGQHLIGMITDRDITVRAVAAGKHGSTTPVSEVMSMNVHCCYEDDPIEDVMEKMKEAQIRRVPVMDRQDRLVGIVSLGDLATKAGAEEEVENTLEDISWPSEPNRTALH